MNILKKSENWERTLTEGGYDMAVAFDAMSFNYAFDKINVSTEDGFMISLEDIFNKWQMGGGIPKILLIATHLRTWKRLNIFLERIRKQYSNKAFADALEKSFYFSMAYSSVSSPSKSLPGQINNSTHGNWLFLSEILKDAQMDKEDLLPYVCMKTGSLTIGNPSGWHSYGNFFFAKGFYPYGIFPSVIIVSKGCKNYIVPHFFTRNLSVNEIIGSIHSISDMLKSKDKKLSASFEEFVFDKLVSESECLCNFIMDMVSYVTLRVFVKDIGAGGEINCTKFSAAWGGCNVIEKLNSLSFNMDDLEKMTAPMFNKFDHSEKFLGYIQSDSFCKLYLAYVKDRNKSMDNKSYSLNTEEFISKYVDDILQSLQVLALARCKMMVSTKYSLNEGKFEQQIIPGFMCLDIPNEIIPKEFDELIKIISFYGELEGAAEIEAMAQKFRKNRDEKLFILRKMLSVIVMSSSETKEEILLSRDMAFLRF